MVLPVHDGGIKPVIGRSRHGHSPFPKCRVYFRRRGLSSEHNKRHSALCYHLARPAASHLPEEVAAGLVRRSE